MRMVFNHPVAHSQIKPFHFLAAVAINSHHGLFALESLSGCNRHARIVGERISLMVKVDRFQACKETTLCHPEDGIAEFRTCPQIEQSWQPQRRYSRIQDL